MNLGDLVSHKKIILPGHVAVLSGKTEELTDWDVLVGPREATAISNWVRDNWID
jgi:acetyl-CoA decarbonylase/synthase complex subunit gamma